MEIFKGDDDRAHGYLICRFDKCFLIDPAHSYDDIIEALGGRQLEGILLTHAHQDHVDLIGRFLVPIYVHASDAHLLFDDSKNGYHPQKHPYHRKDLDLRLMHGKTTLDLADQKVIVHPTPGHTKGGVTYQFQNRLFTGDTLFKESVGRHDLYSGSLPELKRSVLGLLLMPGDLKIHPGHDAPTSIRYEQKHNPFYLKWKKQIKPH
jgi:hydroxyacylglutathione hydrolase